MNSFVIMIRFWRWRRDIWILIVWFHDIELGPKQLFCCCAYKMKENKQKKEVAISTRIFSSCNHSSDVASSDLIQYRGTKASLYGQAVIY